MSDRPSVEGERGVSVVAGSSAPWFSKRVKVAIGIACIIGVIGLIFWKIPVNKPEEEANKTPGRLAPPQRLAELPPAVVMPVVAQAPPPVAPAPTTPPQTLPQVAPLNGQVAQAVGAPPAVRSAISTYAPAPLNEAQKRAAGIMAGAGAPTEPKVEATQVVYKPAVIVGAKTGTIPDRNLILMPGVPFRCTLSTAINSDLPGPLVCTLPADVLSPTGVTLMEKGTQVIGQYESHVKTGDKRVLTIAATAYTPNGVVVPLGGPMADELGRTGVDGEVDNHYWERFGGAVLLTLADSIFSLAQADLSKAGSTNLNISGGGVSSLASEVLRSQINIPPTITINQGREVNVWITAPIDFSPSYKLEPR